MLFIIVIWLVMYSSPLPSLGVQEYKGTSNISSLGSYNFINVLSLCAKNSTKMDSTALILHLSVKSVFEQDRSYRGFGLKYPIGYISFDVCEDMDQLLHLTISFVLDRKYREKDFGTECNDQRCIYGRISSNIMAIIAYMPTNMIIQMANILISEEIVFISYTESEVFPDPLLYPFYIPSYENKPVPYLMSQFLNHFNFKHVGFICLRLYPKQECPDFYKFWNYFKSEKDMKCMTYYSLDAGNQTEIHDFLIKLNSSVSPTILILMEDAHETKSPSLLRKAKELSIKRKVWLITSIPNAQSGVDSDFKNFDDAVFLYIPYNYLRTWKQLYNYFKSKVSGLTDRWYLNDTFVTQTLLELFQDFYANLQGFVENTISQYYLINTQWNKHFIYGYQSYFIRLKNDGSLSFVNLERGNGRFITFEATNIPEDKLKWISNSNTPPKSICPKHSCYPGWGIVFGASSRSLSNWHQEYGWTCKRCEENSVQPLHAHMNCTSCSELTIPNFNKTSCFDMFINQTRRFQGMGTVITLVIAGSGLLYDLILLIVFIKYRKTPCVRSSDFGISVFQIIVSSVIYIALPFSMITKPTSQSCLLRPVVTGFCFSVAIGVALSKVQKILNAFKAKVRQSSKEVAVTKTIQIFIVFLVVVGHVVLAIITFSQSPVSVNIRLYYKAKIRETYCNTDTHTQVQIFYLFVLLLFCNIQGFRGRSLPSNFNETKYIAFATFLAIVCFLVMFPLYYSQTYHKDGNTVQTILIVLSKFLFSMILYTNKLYVILIRPDLNDATKYRNNMMEKMAKKAKKVI